MGLNLPIQFDCNDWCILYCVCVLTASIKMCHYHLQVLKELPV
jgi:hypothetical protein